MRAKINRLASWLKSNNFNKECIGVKKLAENILPPINTPSLPNPDEIRGLFTKEESQSGLERITDEILNQGKIIRQGDTDEETHGLVELIRRSLEDYGYFTYDSPGIFGSSTKKAVIEFQKQNMLNETGEVNGDTLALAFSSAAIKRLEEIEENTPAQPEASAEAPSQVANPSQAPSLGDNSGQPITNQEVSAPNDVEDPPELSAGEYILPGFTFVSVPCKGAAELAKRESREMWGNGNVLESDKYYTDVNSLGLTQQQLADEEFMKRYTVESTIQKYYSYTSMNNSYDRNIDRWGTGTVSVGRNQGQRQMNPVKERNRDGVATDWYHWSAVFISWIMGQFDGEGAKWFVHEGHSAYVASYKAQKGRIQRDPDSHIGKMYYVWFSREEMLRYNLKPEPGDVVGTPRHCDIYVGGGMIIGGNTCANNEQTGGRRVNCKGTSGAQPLRWKSGSGIIKRIKVTGPGSEGLKLT